MRWVVVITNAAAATGMIDAAKPRLAPTISMARFIIGLAAFLLNKLLIRICGNILEYLSYVNNFCNLIHM